MVEDRSARHLDEIVWALYSSWAKIFKFVFTFGLLTQDSQFQEESSDHQAWVMLAITKHWGLAFGSRASTVENQACAQALTLRRHRMKERNISKRNLENFSQVKVWGFTQFKPYSNTDGNFLNSADEN